MSINRITVDGVTHKYEFGGLEGTPSWIGSSKPTYTASEVGALPSSTSIPSKVSQLQNDSGFISDVPVDGTTIKKNASGQLYATGSGGIATETDPTVPAWAKQPSKPTYTASEVGALPSSTSIPSKVSQLQNDSGFVSGETFTSEEKTKLSNIEENANEYTLPVADMSTLGGVMPDGTTIVTDASGVMSVVVYDTPESFGAIADEYHPYDDPNGVDTAPSRNRVVAYANLKAFNDRDHPENGILQSDTVVWLRPGATYYMGVNNILLQDKHDLTIYGNGATLLFSHLGASTRTLFACVGCTNIKIYDLNIATNWDTVVTSDVALDYLRNTTADGISTSYGAVADGTHEWEKMVYMEHQSIAEGNENTKCTYGMSFNDGCTDVVVRGCEISGVGDGLCANDSEDIWFVDNHIHHTYQETIVVRQCKNVVIRGNDLHDHAGDCVIVKAYEEPDLRGIVITENRIHDPVGYADGGFAVGGGITVNAEFVRNDEPGTVAYPTQGTIISNNTVSDCRYGVQVCNVLNCIVANNYASVMMKGNIVNPTWDDGSCAFGLSLQTIWSPKVPIPIANVLFTGNVGSGGAVTFLSWYDASDVPVESVTFSNNMCIASERTKDGQPYYSARCANMRNSLVVGNKFSGGKRFGEFDGCIVKNNLFEDAKAVPDEWQDSDIYLREGGCVFDGNVVTAKWVYVHCTGPTYVGNNVLDLSDKLIVKMDGGQVITVRSNIKNGMPLVAGDVTVSGDATDYHFVE